jgi:hypothetical protein
MTITAAKEITALPLLWMLSLNPVPPVASLRRMIAHATGRDMLREPEISSA